MKIIDITTKDQLDEAFESIMCLATGFMSDRGIIDMTRRVAEIVEFGTMHVEHAVVVTLDTEESTNAGRAEQTMLAAALHAYSFMQPAAVVRMLDKKADDYEKEIA